VSGSKFLNGGVKMMTFLFVVVFVVFIAGFVVGWVLVGLVLKDLIEESQ